MWWDEREAVAPNSWLYQTVDAQKEEVFFPALLITLRRHDTWIAVTQIISKEFWFLVFSHVKMDKTP